MGRYKIYVYAICKNEEKHIRRWMQSMAEADGVYVLDTGSTDNSVSLLRECGAVVQTEILSPWRFDTARNRSLQMVPSDADICVCTDLDEVFHEGWRQKLESAWTPTTRRARYRYTWNFNPDGSEGFVFFSDKIHARDGFLWTHPVHEVLRETSGKAVETVTVDGMQLDHHADNEKSRAQYLPLLEQAVRECPTDDRNMHYLGREYMFKGRYTDAIRTLRRHLELPSAVWKDERCASMRFIALCHVRLQNRPEAERWYLRACAEAPYLREPWLDAASFFSADEKWDAVAACCTRALTITNRPENYISDSKSFGALPYDLLSLAYYYTGRFSESAQAIEKACSADSRNERLRQNRILISSKTKSSPENK